VKCKVFSYGVATTIMAAPEVLYSHLAAHIFSATSLHSSFFRAPCERRDITAKWGTWEIFIYIYI